ncbi:hypothetical protein H2200_004411 [Cladophialophora chaetospira]|uniref:Uncharacterized protein n=1 Tax=Cladophialophora chaetospira TaxID=386627 RepID=A0AA38XD34_9EURO|nr:hypothetical protein H2200_004411 [Cladophialophora chaetospira]
MLLCCALITVYEHFDPYTASSSSPSHVTAALRILRHPATTWTRETRMFFFLFQQEDTVLSLMKTPAVLAGHEPPESVDHELPVLPQRFQTSVEIQETLFKIFRWRFIYSYYHRDWDRHCIGFLKVLAAMRAWWRLLCDYIASMDEKESDSEEVHLAMIFKTQYRLRYAALWHSVDETINHQCPEQVNLVDLSNPAKLVILVPVRVDPQSRDRDWQPATQTECNESRIWPDMEMVCSPRQPPYNRWTFHARRKM